MPAPYTIDETAEASGLSVKFIRRLKGALPEYFSNHTERGMSNALLFDEEIIETLKQTKMLKDKGRTLRQIRDELKGIADAYHAKAEPKIAENENMDDFEVSEEMDETFEIPVQNVSQEKDSDKSEEAETNDMYTAARAAAGTVQIVKKSLERENSVLRSQVNLLQELLRKSEARFERLLPAATEHRGPEKITIKSQLLLWLVEAVVVTTFASGFIFAVWYFAQKTFTA